MTGRQGQTALFLAAETGRIDVVRYLLQHGADPTLVDDMGRGPGDVVGGPDETRAAIRSLLARPSSR
jgi:ankyrin repeat protein